MSHLIIDILEIENIDKIMFCKDVQILLDTISYHLNLNVIGRNLYQFNPAGVTGVYVLAESHLSIHTFYEKNKTCMDLYTCSEKIYDVNLLIDIISTFFDKKCKIQYCKIDR